MLELVLCSLFTIVPDYLYRRYAQGKRIGQEITLYSVWFELRWGITACLMLTVLLITIIFYHHPSTTSASPFFRTVPILPESSGRVSEIYVKWRDKVEKGAPILKLDSTKQEADLEVAKRRIAEVEATMVMARGRYRGSRRTDPVGERRLPAGARRTRHERGAAAAQCRRRCRARDRTAQNASKAARGGCRRRRPPSRRPRRASRRCCRRRKPAPNAALKQAQVDLDKTVVYAGVSGRVEQFTSAGRRHRQSVHAAGRSAHPRGCRPQADPGRLRADRSASHESRHGSGSDLRIEASDRSFRWWSRACRTTSQPGQFRCGRAADRSPAGREARHASGLSGAAV